MKTPINIESAGVKVMRSHDYCHFEVALTSNLLGLNSDEMTLAVDDLRKTAARLADKAVDQYKVAKLALQRREQMADDYALARAKEKPETGRSPLEQAIIKYRSDTAFAARFDYDYEDDWDEQDRY